MFIDARLRRKAALIWFASDYQRNFAQHKNNFAAALPGGYSRVYGRQGPVLNTDGTTILTTSDIADLGTGTDFTWAAVWRATVVTSFRMFLATSETNAGIQVSLNGGALTVTKGGVIVLGTGISPPADVWNFSAFTYRHADGAWVAINRTLDGFGVTDIDATASGTEASAFATGNGIWNIGGRDTVREFIGDLAFQYFGLRRMPPAYLRQWADDWRKPFRAPEEQFGFVAAAPPSAAIMNQLQGPNLGADLYNGTLL